MEWLVAEVKSLLTSLCKDAFSGFLGKIRLSRVEKRLRRNLFENILRRYGNEIYYHDLDSFLSRNKVIYNILINCESVSVHQYKCKTQLIQYYVTLFIETNPYFSRYQSDVYSIIQKCFDIIFNTLNETNATESVRIISNIAKELAGELSLEIENLNSSVTEIKKRLDVQSEIPKFYAKQYFEYLARLYTNKVDAGYIPRGLYYKDSSENDIDSLDALLKDRHVMLLGEAGFGKTYESIALLNKACTSPKAVNVMPVYLPLCEYGILYSNIVEGIKYKISPFCDGDAQKLIRAWLYEGKVILILDGIDDIQSEILRSKFVTETINLTLQYSKCYTFITSRLNRYHGEFGNIKKYFIRCLDHATIKKQLFDAGIDIEIPYSYYQLFGNPLYLEVAKVILKGNANKNFFNRSILFEELVLLISEQWDKTKGLPIEHCLSCAEIIDILGQYSYNTFYQPYIKTLEFEKYITKITPVNANKATIIDRLLSSGLLQVSNGIGFTHKLFKEYFTACYLVTRRPLAENRTIYLDYVNKDEWKEVLIFASGLQKNIEEQDEYLDFIMQNNLQLYIECINAKSDLSIQLVSNNNYDLAKRYLIQISKTYNFIVNRYFSPIASRFDPTPGHAEKNIADKKIQIAGNLSHNGNLLSYWFNRVMPDEPEIYCVNEDQIADYLKRREMQAAMERKTIHTYSINLNLSGLEGDSGRKIAIDLIKKQLKSIIKNKQLIESDYLLCEKLNNYKSKISELKDLSDIAKMEATVEAILQMAKEKARNFDVYIYEGIDLLNLLRLLKLLNNRNIEFCNYILPAPDKTPSSSSYWIWDLYSTNQKINRLLKFFYFHQLSYINMVETNFPVLCNFFSRYLDIPYQNVVLVDLKQDTNDWTSDPSLIYYYVAAPSQFPVQPKLKIINERFDNSNLSDVIYQQIRQSYADLGKTAHYLGWSNTGFSFTIISEKGDENSPLSDYVYDSIQKSLEQVLGKL